MGKRKNKSSQQVKKANPKTTARMQKRDKEIKEIESLEKRIKLEAPAPGSTPVAQESSSSYDAPTRVTFGNAKAFKELPISQKTLKGLNKHKFVKLTDIQRSAIPHALSGRDVLGAAKTGSGKTLAFLIPILEKLYRERWTNMDGIGAIVISPTRELAVQIFDVLRDVGCEHDKLSAGLLVGGKDVEYEQQFVNSMNILVCTPGRLLQHMDETPGFDCSNLKVLVLDEADRILDMKFEREVQAILENIPEDERQTLLFSATQTKNVRDLARLALKDPQFLSVHEQAEFATPKQLEQHYMIVGLHEKLNTLYSFVRQNKKKKMIVFLTTCKEVQFVHEMFRMLRPGVPLMALHGKQKHTKRMFIFYRFCELQNALLFATDVASRGLDFPEVDWVVQMDCPESADVYIHRAGRTARFGTTGKSLLFLAPSELKMVDKLEERKIPMKKIKANPKKIRDITGKITALLIQVPEYKILAQKAFVSYLRSVHKQKDKEVFDVHALPFQEFGESMGLASVPKIRFSKAEGKSKEKGRKQVEDESDSEDEDEDEQGEAKPVEKKGMVVGSGRTKIEKLFRKKNRGVFDERYLAMMEQSDSDDDDDDSDDDSADEESGILKSVSSGKQHHDALDDDEDSDEDSDDDSSDGDDESDDGEMGGVLRKKKGSSRLDQTEGFDMEEQFGFRSKKAARKINVNRELGTRVVFDDEGNEQTPFERLTQEMTLEDMDAEQFREVRRQKIGELREQLLHADKADRKREKQRVKEKHKKEKLKMKKRLGHGKKEEEDTGAILGGVSLGGGSDDEEYDESDNEGGYDDSDNDSDSDSEEETKTRRKKRARNDFESDESEDESEEEEESWKKARRG